jgi:hypothetical protein
MKKILVLFFLWYLIIPVNTNAQSNTGIGTSSPNASAMLDITASNKGLLVPRVALISVTDAVTIPSPATYLIVTNTNAALPDGKGLYINMGTASVPNWVKSGSGSATTNAWSLTGNTATNDGANFIGTTDNVAFNIRMNNQKAGRIDSSYKNTYLGYQSGNSASTGNSNTAFGFQSLFSNTNGNYNTALGYQALFSAVTGGNYNIPNYNTASGYQALYNNTTGLYNTANGATSLYSNTYGQGNTGAGVEALYSNTQGNNNTAIGIGALSGSILGNHNTSIGSGALQANVYGNGNTALGYGANVNSGSFDNSTALGNGTLVYNSNQVQIGNENVNAVFFGNPNVTPIYAGSYNTMSDRRFKYKIEADVPGIAFIKKLKPVTYYLDEESFNGFRKTGIIKSSQEKTNIVTGNYRAGKILHTGFLAQDVEKIARELGYSFDGVTVPKNDKEFYSISYSQFVMPLVKAVQEQQAIIEDQQNQMNDLKARVGEIELLKLQVAELTKAVREKTSR